MQEFARKITPVCFLLFYGRHSINLAFQYFPLYFYEYFQQYFHHQDVVARNWEVDWRGGGGRSSISISESTQKGMNLLLGIIIIIIFINVIIKNNIRRKPFP